MSSQESASPSVNGWNSEYIEAMYDQWLLEPQSVSEEWSMFFQGFDLGFRPSPPPTGEDMPALPEAESPTPLTTAHTRQGLVDSLVYHYRDNGHMAALLDPLGTRRPDPPNLSLDSYGLSDSDLDEVFDPCHLPLPNPSTLRQIIDLLQKTYCHHFGAEYMHIQDRERRRWLQEKMETVQNAPAYPGEQKLRILRTLIQAHAFESFLDKRYRGKKRFSLEGGESLISILNEMAELAPGKGIQEYALAMAHRGRLNVLVNIVRKTYDQIFTEFDESWIEDFVESGGDVKYHRGYSGDFVTSDGQQVRFSLSPNPSHLEYVNSVVLGRTRAKQRLRGDEERTRCVPLLIHGDASFPGQGIVAECFNMMRLDGYNVGGCIHVLVNNQVGFTTDPRDAHSGMYCTDLAKMVEAPIFHVNGDDPEACVFAAQLAIAYRQQFMTDVVIELWCYRKHGHNEGDEPSFTQPELYRMIRQQVPVVEHYASRLMEEGIISQEEYDALYESIRTELDEAQARSKVHPVKTSVDAFKDEWKGLKEAYSDEPVQTGVSEEALVSISQALGTAPDGCAVHPKLITLLQKRHDAITGNQPLNWAMGELLAYGSLLLEGTPVRLTGQDVQRGTFSHRHALLFDQETGEPHVPLNHIAGDQALLCCHNSPLTESACLGFEYGYSLGDPNMLVIWEAQFGDFVNGAQVIIDQFIASAEVKWQRYSGLVCLLPHGYEGQGPEHSSARLERFLTLCANDDMQVVQPTTPSQMFHVLRRQMRRNFRKPLIIMTPKSLLRHPLAVSPVSDFVNERFHHLLDDTGVVDREAVTMLLLCSGKIYYELAERRDAIERRDIAIIRCEQLFPFRERSIELILEKYPNAAKFRWVQEEPKNMGAFRYIEPVLREEFGIRAKYIGRAANASPAVASLRIHQQQQNEILTKAVGFDGNNEEMDGLPPLVEGMRTEPFE